MRIGAFLLSAVIFATQLSAYASVITSVSTPVPPSASSGCSVSAGDGTTGTSGQCCSAKAESEPCCCSPVNDNAEQDGSNSCEVVPSLSSSSCGCDIDNHFISSDSEEYTVLRPTKGKKKPHRHFDPSKFLQYTINVYLHESLF